MARKTKIATAEIVDGAMVPVSRENAGLKTADLMTVTGFVDSLILAQSEKDKAGQTQHSLIVNNILGMGFEVAKGLFSATLGKVNEWKKGTSLAPAYWSSSKEATARQGVSHYRAIAAAIFCCGMNPEHAISIGRNAAYSEATAALKEAGIRTNGETNQQAAANRAKREFNKAVKEAFPELSTVDILSMSPEEFADLQDKATEIAASAEERVKIARAMKRIDTQFAKLAEICGSDGALWQYVQDKIDAAQSAAA